MNKKNPKVDAFITSEQKWQKEFKKLRAILLGRELVEDFKWGVPCYTDNKRNVILMHGFKEYCALLFVKGALVKDPLGILVTQTEHVQSAKQIRFTDAREITQMEPVLKDYIDAAIQVERAGLKVNYRETSEFFVTREFQEQMDEMPELRTAFEGLTPGRQRAYLLYFAAPRQSKTRAARVEKYIQHILAGKGLNDE
jgi:uncharacterized protein YdeI (YjbR/CyaY-like superfamily)